MSALGATVPSAPADIADEAITTLVGLRIDDGHQAAWPAWRLGAPDEPARMAADDVSLYNGDAGIAWTLAVLGRALGRAELTVLAGKASRRVLANVVALSGEGLLGGRAGARLAAYACGEAMPVDWGRPIASDLTEGAAGVLLAQVRTGVRPDGRLVQGLARSARAQDVGWSWTERDESDPDAGERALCGLAHGASGVALALVEAAAATGTRVGPALALAVGGLAWENAWFDPARGWPDLRTDTVDYPVWWCHGGAGMTAVRLRLLQLAGRGVDLGMPLTSLQAQAHAGLDLCREHVRTAVAAAGDGMPPAAGLSLCHGLGGALDALVLGSEVTGSEELLDLAAEGLAAAATVMGPDLLAWPCGTRQPGSASLFLGLAGVVLVAARIAWPQAGIPSPSLLG